MRITHSLAAALFLVLTAIPNSVIAKEAAEDIPYDCASPTAKASTQLPEGTVVSVDAAATPYANANQIELAAEYAARNHNYDQSIALCQRALKAQDDDLDIHKAYAEALEGKLKSEKRENPELFNACVREWLIVLRTEKGDEKGLTFHGIGIPGMGHFYQDEEHEMVARVHLKDLTKTTPKAWETNDMYLKRTERSTALSVQAEIAKPESAPAAAGAPPTPHASTTTTQTRSGASTKSADPLGWMKD